MRQNKNRKLSKTGKILITTCIIVAITIVSVITYFSFHSQSNETVEATPTPTPTATPTPTPTVDPLSEKYNMMYDQYYSLNTDYVCYLEFKNQLLYNYTDDEKNRDQYPGVVVKSHQIEDGEGDVNSANEEYLRYDINHNYLDIGQEFMDGSNVLDENNLPTDQNIIIYGHFVYADHNLKFSPLHTFEDASQYEQYDTFTLTFNHQQRTYQVTDAFFYDINTFITREDSPFATNYTEEQLNTYMNRVKSEYNNTLDTGITITSSDSFVTLQTCVEGRDDLRYLVLGKEIDRVDFE